MKNAERMIEQVVDGCNVVNVVNEDKVVDAWHIKSVLKALQTQTQSLIRAGANIPKNMNRKEFNKSTAHLAKAISMLDDWVKFNVKVKRPGYKK